MLGWMLEGRFFRFVFFFPSVPQRDVEAHVTWSRWLQFMSVGDNKDGGGHEIAEF